MARKVNKKRTTGKKPRYVCKSCGLIVSVDKTCGCVDTCDIICCGRPMKEKR